MSSEFKALCPKALGNENKYKSIKYILSKYHIDNENLVIDLLNII
jgi:hypothetical protein